MTTLEKTNTTKRSPFINHRAISVLVGVLFIIGTVAGGMAFSGASILEDPDYLVKISENESQVLISAAFVLIMGFALSLMAVILFPMLRKYNEILAVGSVVFRGVLEAVMYLAIVMNWLLQITISRAYVKGSVSSVSQYEAMGTLLKGASYWSDHLLAIVFTLGALMIYYILYRSKLVPRWLSAWGFIGAILYLAAPLLNVFDPLLPALSLTAGWGRLMWPLAVQEMIFALWLIIKGFNKAAINSLAAKQA